MSISQNGQRPKGYWQKPNNWIRLLTLGFVAAYTGAQIWLIVIIKDNNVATLRPFLFPQVIGGSLAILTDQGNQPGISVNLWMANNGGTATKDLRFFVRCAPSAESMPEPWVLLYRGAVNFTPQVVGPHSGFPFGCGFTNDKLIAVSKKEGFAYVLVDAHYADTLESGSHYRTEAVLEVYNVAVDPNKPDSVIGVQLRPVGQHNCADGGCPPQTPEERAILATRGASP